MTVQVRQAELNTVYENAHIRQLEAGKRDAEEVQLVECFAALSVYSEACRDDRQKHPSLGRGTHLVAPFHICGKLDPEHFVVQVGWSYHKFANVPVQLVQTL